MAMHGPLCVESWSLEMASENSPPSILSSRSVSLSSVSSQIDSIDTSNEEPVAPPAAGLLSHLKSALDVGICSDVRICAFGETFKLHKLILVQCNYFSTLFSTTWDRNESEAYHINFEDPNITVDAFKVALRYLYNPCYEDDHYLQLSEKGCSSTSSLSLCCQMVAIASFLDLEQLAKAAVNEVLFHLSLLSLPYIASFFEQNIYGNGQSAHILNKCKSLLCLRGSDTRVLQLYTLSSIPVEFLLDVIISDYLVVPNESNRCSFVIQWYLAEMELARNGSELTSVDFSTMPSKSRPNSLSSFVDGFSVDSVERRRKSSLVQFSEYPFASHETHKERAAKIRSVLNSSHVLLHHLHKDELINMHTFTCPFTGQPLLSLQRLQEAVWSQTILAYAISRWSADTKYSTKHEHSNLGFRFTGIFALSDIHSLGIHERLYSRPQFYGGSYWNICLQRKSQQLAVLLHRATDGEIDSPPQPEEPCRSFPKSTDPPYIDNRSLVKVRYSITTPRSSSDPSILRFGPVCSEFKTGQTWGWNSKTVLKASYDKKAHPWSIDSKLHAKCPSTFKFTVNMEYVM